MVRKIIKEIRESSKKGGELSEDNIITEYFDKHSTHNLLSELP